MIARQDLNGRSVLSTLLLVLLAAVIAAALTYQTSKWYFPSRLRAARPDRVTYGTMYLTELIDKKNRLYGVEYTGEPGLPDDFDNDERIRRFCRKVHEQALKYRLPDAIYDVWSAEFGGGARGWPLEVNAGYHIVDISQKDQNGKILTNQFWLDDLGEPSFRLGGLLGNGLIFFVAMVGVLEIGYRGVRALKRRWAKPPPGHCLNCGYNLTGNLSGICSECGQVIRPEQG